jgi:uncharacterized Zn-binding protein involved in type VI secretion
MPRFVGTVTGTCTGEGKPIPANIHQVTVGHTGPGSGAPCCVPAPKGCPVEAGGQNTLAKTKPLAVVSQTCMWPPQTTVHKVPATACKTVKVNGQIPLLDGDILTDHITPSTNMIQHMFATPPVPKACSPCSIPVLIPCTGSLLSTEDSTTGSGPGKGHIRKVIATTATVFFEGRKVAAIGDPLGPPCFAKISKGATNVVVGK